MTTNYPQTVNLGFGEDFRIIYETTEDISSVEEIMYMVRVRGGVTEVFSSLDMDPMVSTSVGMDSTRAILSIPHDTFDSVFGIEDWHGSWNLTIRDEFDVTREVLRGIWNRTREVPE